MPELNRLRYLYFAYLSRPRAERQLYRCIRKRRVSQIVEIGIRCLPRTLRMLRVAAPATGLPPVRYTGIDAFEDRPTGTPPLSLKEAYRSMRATGANPLASLRLLDGLCATPTP